MGDGCWGQIPEPIVGSAIAISIEAIPEVPSQSPVIGISVGVP